MASLVYVDDNPIDQFIFQKQISRFAPHLVITRYKSPTALIAALQDQDQPVPLVVVLEVCYAYDTVWPLLALLNHWQAPTRVIITTCSIHPPDEAQSRQFANISHYFIKPLSCQQIQTILSYFP